MKGNLEKGQTMFALSWKIICKPKSTILWKSYTFLVKTVAGTIKTTPWFVFLWAWSSWKKLTCDFVLIKKMLNRAERFYTVQQYIELLCASLRKFHMFQVMKVARHFIIDFKTWCPRFYKKTCLSNDSYGRAVLRSQK